MNNLVFKEHVVSQGLSTITCFRHRASFGHCGAIGSLIPPLGFLIGGEGNGTHSSTLAWKIPWAEEPGGLQSMGLLRVRHD